MIRFRHLWGREKRADLLASSEQDGETLYQPVEPPIDLGLPFMPVRSAGDYLSWPLLPDLFPVSYPGVKTSRDNVIVDIDRDRLVRRMEQYFDPNVSHAEMRHIAPGVMESTARFHAEAVRDALRHRGFLPDKIVRYCYRPFDVRWLYWEPETDLLDRKREDYFPQVFEGNVFLFTTGRTRKDVIEPALPTQLLNDLNCMDSGARGFPLYRRAGTLEHAADVTVPMPNMSELAAGWLSSLGCQHQRSIFSLYKYIALVSI